ncbi:hypothetical protein D3C86_1159060 [compost metagenome]
MAIVGSRHNARFSQVSPVFAPCAGTTFPQSRPCSTALSRRTGKNGTSISAPISRNCFSAVPPSARRTAALSTTPGRTGSQASSSPCPCVSSRTGKPLPQGCSAPSHLMGNRVRSARRACLGACGHPNTTCCSRTRLHPLAPITGWRPGATCCRLKACNGTRRSSPSAPLPCACRAVPNWPKPHLP